MKVIVKFFALHRETVGKEKISLDVEEDITVGNLLQLLVEKYPSLRKLEEHTFISLNHEYADKNRKLKSGDEVALFPPVGGG